MMDPYTGDVALLDSDEFRRFLDGEEPTPPGKVLLSGTDEQIARLSRTVRLGNKELANRAARRAQQKASRRRNR